MSGCKKDVIQITNGTNELMNVIRVDVECGETCLFVVDRSLL